MKRRVFCQQHEVYVNWLTVLTDLSPVIKIPFTLMVYVTLMVHKKPLYCL